MVTLVWLSWPAPATYRNTKDNKKKKIWNHTILLVVHICIRRRWKHTLLLFGHICIKKDGTLVLISFLLASSFSRLFFTILGVSLPSGS